MNDYILKFMNEDDFGNTVFKRKNCPIPAKGDTVFLIDLQKIRKFCITRLEYNYYERNPEYFVIDVFLKEIKE